MVARTWAFSPLTLQSDVESPAAVEPPQPLSRERRPAARVRWAGWGSMAVASLPWAPPAFSWTGREAVGLKPGPGEGINEIAVRSVSIDEESSAAPGNAAGHGGFDARAQLGALQRASRIERWAGGGDGGVGGACARGRPGSLCLLGGAPREDGLADRPAPPGAAGPRPGRGPGGVLAAPPPPFPLRRVAGAGSMALPHRRERLPRPEPSPAVAPLAGSGGGRGPEEPRPRRGGSPGGGGPERAAPPRAGGSPRPLAEGTGGDRIA